MQNHNSWKSIDESLEIRSQVQQYAQRRNND
jgi:hypothetical protein